jgi:hypothetical protein
MIDNDYQLHLSMCDVIKRVIEEVKIYRGKDNSASRRRNMGGQQTG